LSRRRRKKSKTPPPAPPTTSELQEVLAKHLPYEIGWLADQYDLLLHSEKYDAGLSAELRKALHDALIVSFCTHARNALEFFFRDSHTKYKYALATDYADAKGYTRLDRRTDADVDRLYKQLCAQINHITYERTDDDKRKMNAKEWKELVDIISREAERLDKAMTSGEYDKGHLKLELLADAAASSIKAGAGGASSQPSSSGPTGPSARRGHVG
jgi:hypothetical protein